jgi:hypothetical protein
MYHTGMKTKKYFIIEFKDLSEQKQTEIISHLYNYLRNSKFLNEEDLDNLRKDCEKTFVEWEVVIDE